MSKGPALPDYLTDAIKTLIEKMVLSDRGGGRVARNRARMQLEECIRAYGEDQYNRGNRDGMGLP